MHSWAPRSEEAARQPTPAGPAAFPRASATRPLWTLLLCFGASYCTSLSWWIGGAAGQSGPCDSDCLHPGREARNIEHLGFSHNIEHLCFLQNRSLRGRNASRYPVFRRGFTPGRTSRWNNPAGGRAARGRVSAARRAAEGAPSELLGAAPGAAEARSGLGAVTCCQEPFWMPFARKK